jgi:hypothetical protein
MREQPVISDADSQAPGYPPQDHCGNKALPGKHEERCDRAHMKCHHKKGSDFADWFPKRPVPLEKIHEYVSPLVWGLLFI